ncbi:MAG: alpha/beta family hydrolase [Bacteroidota bacterium]
MAVKSRKSNKVLLGIRLLMPIFAVSFLVWQITSMQARNVDDALLESSATVTTTHIEEYIEFKPATDTLGAGLLFYPGALVDPVAYVPMARAIAEAGFVVRIIKVPYRMDRFPWQREAVKERTDAAVAERNWVLGGHSRGARMALAYTVENEAKLSGLLLIGSSHPREVSHANLAFPVLKIYGSRDGLASPEEVEQYKHNLPAHTIWHRVEGGNHAQFAWYGSQLGDDSATISREAQHQATVNVIVEFLNAIP